jgi:hypothetical protein
MEFMLLFKLPADAPDGTPDGMAEMTAYAQQLADQGKLLRGAPLAGSGVSVRVHDDQAVVSDGPFAESKEVLGGFWLIRAADRAEALDIARRCPHAQGGTVELQAVRRRWTYRDSENGTPFLFAFRTEPGLCDPNGAKLRQMLDFADRLAANGGILETAPLADDPPPARIETRRGAMLVTDGPFAESKEGVGGYSVVRAAGPGEALELAKRYPHATWGRVEVREILFFDRTSSRR